MKTLNELLAISLAALICFIVWVIFSWLISIEHRIPSKVEPAKFQQRVVYVPTARPYVNVGQMDLEEVLPGSGWEE